MVPLARGERIRAQTAIVAFVTTSENCIPVRFLRKAVARFYPWKSIRNWSAVKKNAHCSSLKMIPLERGKRVDTERAVEEVFTSSEHFTPTNFLIKGFGDKAISKKVTRYLGNSFLSGL